MNAGTFLRFTAMTDAQRRLIFGLCRRLGIDDDARKAIAARYNPRGEATLTALDKRGAREMIDELMGKAHAHVRNLYRRLTPAQRYKIEGLAREAGLRPEERLNGFVRKFTRERKHKIDELGFTEAGALIEALKKIAARGGLADRPEQF